MRYTKPVISPDLLEDDEPKTKQQLAPRAIVTTPAPADKVEADIQKALEQLESGRVNIAEYHPDWVKLGFAFASLGEGGRDYFHRVSSISSKYDHQECDKQYNICLKEYDGSTQIKSFFQYCKDAGINISFPGVKASGKTLQNSTFQQPRDNSIPFEMEMQIRKKKRDGYGADSVVSDLSTARGIAKEVLQPAVDRIYAEKPVTIERFWSNICVNEQKDKWQLTLFHNKYINFLREAGFGMYREGEKFNLVRVQDNIVRYANRKEVKDFVQEYIESLPFEFDGIYRIELEDKIKREHLTWFADGTMEWLPDIGADFQRDTRDIAFFYFRNGFVEVTKTSIELRPYSELERMIWETQIIDRDFQAIDMEENDDALTSDFYCFCYNVSGQDTKRLLALLSSIGYLLHGHKVRTHSYAIILCDEQITNGPAGRTGKGIIIQALKHIRNTVTIDGRNFRIENQFAYQRVHADTDLIAFDDVDPKRLPFERLFSILTEGLSVERKQAGEVLIPFDEAPKIIITTNETVIGEGGSYEGRMRELELSPYYSTSFTPEEEFGRILFDDWDPAEWQLFDNLMMHCTQIYMLQGVVRQKQINLNRRKLIQKTCEEFPEFMESLALEAKHRRKQLHEDFCSAYGFTDKQLTVRKFNQWLKDWAYYEGLSIDDKEREPNMGPGIFRDYYVVFSRVLKIAN